jgi:hypothetical protein
VLLDENIPHQLSELIPHEVMTVAYMGWASWRNGILLGAADDAGFDVRVTGCADRRIDRASCTRSDQPGRLRSLPVSSKRAGPAPVQALAQY